MCGMWILAACGSAFFAGITAILAKIGTQHIDSDIATAIRTIVVAIFAWFMVAIVGSLHTISTIQPQSLLFLVLSGLATGASWICYFKALSQGNVNVVVPIDKSSTILTVLLAIICFGETDHLAIKLVGTVILTIGILLMVERKPATQGEEQGKRTYILYAIGSAVFAALTSILAKVGIANVESNLGTAIRTIVVLIMAWIVVLMQGKHKQLHSMDRKELVFVCLSGLATGASWLCYYYAIQQGVVSVVVPIDKLSILVSIAFSYVVFKEKLTLRSSSGLALMVISTLAMTIFA